MKIIQFIRFFTILLIFSYSYQQMAGHMFAPKKDEKMTKMSLNQLLRKLWAEHVVWTKLYVMSAIADTPDKKPTTERLLKNQEDFGKAIAKFYGKKAGDELTKLLKEHILIAADIVECAKANNNECVKTKDKLWRKNARDIAHLLAGANKYFSEKDLTEMLYKHLDLLTNEVQTRLGKKWAEEPKIFDEVFDQALDMGDGFSEAIAKQKRLR